MWPNPFLASAMLAFEAQHVIGLRLAKLALGGPAAHVEAELMLSEKMKASADAAALLTRAMLSGRSTGPDQVVKLLRRRVKANKTRLLK